MPVEKKYDRPGGVYPIGVFVGVDELAPGPRTSDVDGVTYVVDDHGYISKVAK